MLHFAVQRTGAHLPAARILAEYRPTAALRVNPRPGRPAVKRQADSKTAAGQVERLVGRRHSVNDDLADLVWFTIGAPIDDAIGALFDVRESSRRTTR